MLALGGCSAIAGLDQFTVETGGAPGGGGAAAGTGGSSGAGGTDGDAEAGTGPRECETNNQCTTRATLAAGTGPIVPAVCLSTGTCATLTTEDCTLVTGDYTNDAAIVIGSLLATTGPQAAANVQRQQGATLAVEEVNSVGGIPAAGGGRPLVMVSCDAQVNLMRAAGHLITDLHVPAIVGPSASQDTLDVSTRLSVQAGTVLVTPSSLASSIADLLDNDLTWLMVPNDVQRSPLMINQINALETQLHGAPRSLSSVKLSIIYRNDALGVGTRTSLDALNINGQPLAAAVNAGSPTGNVRIEPYVYTDSDQSAIVTRQVAFAPDIVVFGGTAEAVTKVMVPLEAGWNTLIPRPYYILIDSTKVPDLIAAIGTTNPNDLRHRVRGTGITPGPTYKPVLDAFNLDYQARYQMLSTASGVGPSYDAAYAIAYALAASRDMPMTGANIALGLRRLAGGTTTIETGGQKVLAAFSHLASGENITARGTFGPLSWNTSGAVVGGTIEIWCVGAPSGPAVYQSSGLTYDIETQVPTGAYTQCPPPCDACDRSGGRASRLWRWRRSAATLP